MNICEKNALDLFYAGKINSEELRCMIEKDKLNISKFILNELSSAIEKRSQDDIEDVILLFFIYPEIKREVFIPPLCHLILQDWHYKHEDIASLFQKWKNPQTISVLYETTNKSFDYLEYDDSFALAVKCIWALGDIATAESFDKLKTLSESTNPIIKENASYQLKKHAIT